VVIMPHVETAEPFPLRRIKSPSRPPIAWGRAVSAGIAAGQVAGVTMAIAMVGIFHFALDRSPFLPFRLIGASLLAVPRGSDLSALVPLIGLGAHLLFPSLVWGVGFGVLVVLARPERASALLLLGLAMGALAQIMDAYILVPWAGEQGVLIDYWTPVVHPVWSWLFHLIFGVGLSIYPWKYDPSVARFV
jgi:hypothetical protein